MKIAASPTAPAVALLLWLSLFSSPPCLSAPPGSAKAAPPPADSRDESVKPISTLNPVGWMLRPVTQLQAQSLRLEEKIVDLTGPITALPPALVALEDKMVGVQNQIGVVGHELGSMKTDISDMRTHLVKLQKPITELRDPIVSLQKPLSQLKEPLSLVGDRLDRLDHQLNDLKTLLGLVLTSIFVAAALIALGTPAAAFLIWRNRRRFRPDSRRVRRAVPGDGRSPSSPAAPERQQALSARR